MNLKFFEDIIKTIEIMKSGFYYLGVLIGVHTVTFAAYLAYKYLNENNTPKRIQKEEEASDTQNEPELPPPLPQTSEPVIQMEEVSNLVDKKEVYKSLLEQKREELSTLIVQLDSVYDNIGIIRERLESLNNKPN